MRATAPGKVAASRRRRDRESPSRLNAINIASIVAVFILVDSPGAFAAPFADKAALKTAVDNCLAVNATGVACCNHGADCGAAGTAEMADWDVSLVTDMNDLFNYKESFNADISRWDVSSVTSMYMMFYYAAAFNADISRWDVSSVTNMRAMFYQAYAFNADISLWDVSSVTNMNEMFVNAAAFNADITPWDTSSATNMVGMFAYASAWQSRFHNCGYDSSHQACGEVAFYTSSSGATVGPPAAWVRIDDACDASTPPLNGDVGNCTDTLVSGTSCVPECHPGYVLQGVTSCTDRVLTQEAVCEPEVSTRAELKAAVDACIGDRFCEPTMPHWDVSRVTDMSYLFQDMTGFNVDISRWAVSQVTDARGMFQGASSFYQDLAGWTFAQGAETTGMFSGADAWLSRVSRDDSLDTTDGPPGDWSLDACPANEHVELGLCAPCPWGGLRAAGDDPALGDTTCAFPDQNALKTAVDNCLRVDPTGVACCNHGADCGAAGTAEMTDWDVSLVTDMLSLFNGKSQFNADISRWDVSSVTNMQSMFYGANAFDADISRWDVSSVTSMKSMFYRANAFNADISRWDVSSVTNMERMFYQAYAFDADITRWDTSMVTYLFQMFFSATAWKSRFHNCGSDSSSHQACGEVAFYASSSGSNDGPPAAWVRKDDACDASTPPDNGDVGNCTDTLVSGTSCVPECNAGYVLQGVTSCTDRLLTQEAVCVPEVSTRAELKAAVDACIGDRFCEPTMPHWDVSRVTDMSYLFQDMTGFNVDISRWAVSQVTDARGMFQGASSFYQDLAGWTFAQGAETTGMFSGADAWLSRVSRDDSLDTTDGPPGDWSLDACPANEHVELGLCAPCPWGGLRAAGDDPASGDTTCAFPDQNALKTAVDNCLRVEPTGVACCNHGANCGAAGTAEMTDWDVSLVTDMNSLFRDKGSFNADISRWDVSLVTDMLMMFYGASQFNADISGWDVSSVTNMRTMFQNAAAFNADISRWDVSSVTNMYYMFYQAGQFDADISRWDVSSVTNMEGMFQWAPVFNADISRWDVSSVTNMDAMFLSAAAFNADITRWDTSSATNMAGMFAYASAWESRFHNCGSDSSHQACGEVAFYTSSSGATAGPPAAWVRIDDACDASTPPLNGDVGNCTDTLVSGTSCVPECHPGYVLQGVTSCTDRVLTQEATCAWRFPDGDGLKAILAPCLDAVPSGERCCSSDRLCWHPDPVMRRCGAVGCSDMPEWDVSQVTDAQDLFAGRSSFHQAITGWTFAQGANAAGMFTGADAWLAHSARIDGMNSTDGPPSQWNFLPCLENERVESKLCVACRIGWVRAAGDDPYKENTACSLTFPSEGPHVYLAASAETTCAVSMAGEMKCWGQNNYGQLGYGDTSRRGDSAGEMGDALPILDFGGSSLAVKVKSLSVGFEHSCAILNDGGLRCWGRNANGQLGYGDTDNRGELPTSMGKNLPAVDLGSGRSAKFIATGHYHTCVILDDGGVKCWGRNDNGQLGYGDTNTRGNSPGSMGDNLPAVDLGPGQSAKFIALGADHTCVILGDGGVKCWGGNGYGQLGYGDTNNYNSGGSLAAVHFSPTVKTVAAGNSRTCVMLYGGSVKCWGRNDNGQLGYGDTNTRGNSPGSMGDNLPAVDLGSGRSAKFIATANHHTCAILDDGSTKCWGANPFGQLGYGDTTNRGNSPESMGDGLPAVDLGSGRSAKFIAVGFEHTCAQLDDGSMKCWGRNAYGELGYGDTVNRGDGPGEMGDDLPSVSLGDFDVAEPWPYVIHPWVKMKKYGFNVDPNRCAARDYRSHCPRPMDVKTNADNWPSYVNPTPVNPNSCARNLYRTGGRVVFSLVDDNSVKDLPSSAAEIAAGFQNPNAFYIGNAELEAINIKSAKMCLERSKARGDSECNTNCLDIVDSHWSSCDAHAIFSSGTKNVIMAMTGQLAMGSCSSFYDGQTGCDSTTGDYCWSCGRNGKVGQASSIQNNWHAHNYGMNLRRDGGTDELYHYTTTASGECAMVYENGDTYWDSFYIVVQE